MFDTNKPSIDDDQETYISERTSVPSANKRVSIYPTKDPHSLQYFYNQLPENGVPLATQYKQEKKLKKPYRKAPPGQGTLVSIPERPPEFNENYYPYTYYSQLRFPEKPKLYHQTIDGQMVPNESLDLSQYIHEPNQSNPSKKRRHHKKSHHKSTKYHYNTENQIFETVSPIKDNTNIETKADNKLTDLPSQSLSPNNKSKHHRHHHNHHHHHHTHSPEKEYIDAEFKVVDVSFKKSDPSPFFARPKNSFTLPPPNIYNPSSYLPPIPQAHYHSQLLNTNWQDPPQPSLPTKNRSLDFYDRYLNTIIRDKLTTDN